MSSSLIFLFLTMVYLQPERVNHETPRHVCQIVEKAIHSNGVQDSQKELRGESDERRHSSVINDALLLSTARLQVGGSQSEREKVNYLFCVERLP